MPESKFYTEAVLVKVHEAVDVIAEEVAFALEGQAKANIVANNQVDTGFMLNSVYAVTRSGSGYGKTMNDGPHSWDAKKHGGQSGSSEGRKGPEVALGTAKAVVVVGAEYAVYQEEKQSFLYKAGEDVAGQIGGIVEKVGREQGF